MQAQVAAEDPRFRGDAVLVVLKPEADGLSVFEQAVMQRLDGRRDNQDVAAAVGISVEDLRIALTALLQKGLLGVVTLPSPSRRAPSAVTRAPEPVRGPARMHDDRHGAASLQARSLHALRHGYASEARALAEHALLLAPGVAMHQEILDGWEAHVEKNLAATLADHARIDAVRAALAQTAESAGAWSLLATLLVANDQVDSAAAAAARANDLEPTPARDSFAKSLAARASRASRFARFKKLMTPSIPPSRGSRRA